MVWRIALDGKIEAPRIDAQGRAEVKSLRKPIEHIGALAVKRADLHHIALWRGGCDGAQRTDLFHGAFAVQTVGLGDDSGKPCR